MKKNGFIATSLIYSFFLVFCAVLVSYASISLHNKLLLSKVNDNIRKNLARNYTIDVGSYFRIDGLNSEYNDWISYKISDNSIYLVSDRLVRKVKTNEELLALKDELSIAVCNIDIVGKDIIDVNSILDDSGNFLYYDNNTYFKYNTSTQSSEKYNFGEEIGIKLSLKVDNVSIIRGSGTFDNPFIVSGCR